MATIRGFGEEEIVVQEFRFYGALFASQILSEKHGFAFLSCE